MRVSARRAAIRADPTRAGRARAYRYRASRSRPLDEAAPANPSRAGSGAACPAARVRTSRRAS